MKKLTNKKGFTLTELIVVIAIIAILSAVLIPALTGYIGRARESAFNQKVDGINTVMEGYLTEIAADTVAKDGSAPVTFATYYQSITGNTLASTGITVAIDTATDKVTYTQADYTQEVTFAGALATALDTASL